MIEIEIDCEKAAFVFGKILEKFLKKEYPFNLKKAQPPQINNLPKNLSRGSAEHARFLFCLCYYMRGGIQSDTAIRSLARLYEEYPDVFAPENWKNMNYRKMGLLLKSYGLGFNSKEIGKSWVNNFQRLQNEWSGNPVNLLKGISTYEEACERIMNQGGIKGFYGFREKMVSMLIYFLADAGFIDPFVFPIPVDFHVCRIMLANEIIKIKNPQNGENFYQKEILDQMRQLSVEYCRQNNISPLRLCDALWLYSRLLCGKYIGNTSVIGERHGRSTPIAPISKWSAAQEKVYEKSCHSCVLASTCKWCVPSAHYYIQGKLILRGERDCPPQYLFDFAPPNI